MSKIIEMKELHEKCITELNLYMYFSTYAGLKLKAELHKQRYTYHMMELASMAGFGENEGLIEELNEVKYEMFASLNKLKEPQGMSLFEKVAEVSNPNVNPEIHKPHFIVSGTTEFYPNF